MAALLWPSHALSAFDGAPLSGRFEALVVGVVVPALWWMDRAALQAGWMRALVVLVLLVRAGGSLLVQEGWCARFTAAAPLGGAIQTIPIDEPGGVLRSWDVRADWRAEHPRCTAILDRPYQSAGEFPAWFLNIVDHLPSPPRPIAMEVRGDIAVTERGTLVVRTGADMALSGRIGSREAAASGGDDLRAELAPGSHEVRLRATLSGSRWRFEPRWNGESAWRSALLTVAPAGTGTRVLTRGLGWLSTLLVSLLVGGWLAHAAARLRGDAALMAWAALASVLLIGTAMRGSAGRFATVLLGVAAAVPVAGRNRNLRGAFVLLGVPWLAFFAARSFPDVARITRYSGDDYLTYQLAAARIYMHGFWLEGGSATFDYQPLYRWIAGALHLVFGDSSVGETYADAMWLLAGALLAFAIARRFAGFRAGIAAGAVTLATCALSPIWHFVGRGLSEVSAAGFGFVAAAFLLRARLGRRASAAAAGLFALLMFYTRLNQLAFAAALPVLLLPSSTPARIAAVVRAARQVPARAALVYVAILAAGVALFAVRTWYYTGVFSVLYGTSLRHNDLGLSAAGLATAEPWRRIAHSVSALVWLNEPGRPDVRAAFVVAGVLASLGALCQVPRLRRLPAPLVLATLGATASAFVVHTHNYPGRMSIHLVPFAVCAAICALAPASGHGLSGNG